MNTKKLAQLTQYIESADLALQQARDVLAELGGDKVADKMARSKAQTLPSEKSESEKSKIVEGVFNGQNMIGPDGKEYSVPANYASKSKLVEGDVLKLTIGDNGSFLYKQIKPIERARVKGEIVIDEVSGQFSVLCKDGKKYNVLTASVTYFKGETGDEATILIPKNEIATWAAIENIIRTDNANDFSVQQEINSQIEKIEDNSPPLESNHAVELGDIDGGHKVENQKPEEYKGLTHQASVESILPDIEELSGEENEEYNEKSEQEKNKIQEMINNEDLDINDFSPKANHPLAGDIDDLDKKDFDDL